MREWIQLGITPWSRLCKENQDQRGEKPLRLCLVYKCTNEWRKEYYIFRLKVIVVKGCIAKWVGMNEGVLIQSLSRIKGVKPVSMHTMFVIWLPNQEQTHWELRIPDTLALDRFWDDGKRTETARNASKFLKLMWCQEYCFQECMSHRLEKQGKAEITF